MEVEKTEMEISHEERRDALRAIGKFATHTAPAMMVLLASENVLAGPDKDKKGGGGGGSIIGNNPGGGGKPGSGGGTTPSGGGKTKD